MKLVLTSDWHGSLPADLPDGDVLIVAGDLCPVWDHKRQFQANWLKGTLRPFLEDLPYEDILIIGGNHDFVLEDSRQLGRNLCSEKVRYLQDEETEISGLKFYGSPWSTRFYDWAFMKEDEDLEVVYGDIPEDIDVLIAHGPPYGAGDKTADGISAGSHALRAKIAEIQPKLVVTGHIHEAYGKYNISDTDVYNVSYLNLDYTHWPSNAPVVVEV